MSAFRALIIAVFIGGIIGCTKPQRTEDGMNGPQSGQGSATFDLTGDCGGDGETSSKSILNDSWNVPLSAKLSFWACIKDRATRGDANGHKFEIENPETGQRFEVIEGHSNPSGCVRWKVS